MSSTTIISTGYIAKIGHDTVHLGYLFGGDKYDARPWCNQSGWLRTWRAVTEKEAKKMKKCGKCFRK